MKKKSVLILGIVLILCLGLGGKLYMDRKEEQKKQILQAEEDIALYIVQNYEEVHSINFDEFIYFNETGSWNVTVTINNDEDNWIAFTSSNLKNILSDIIIRYNPEEFSLTSKKDESMSLKNIDVNYGGF